MDDQQQRMRETLTDDDGAGRLGRRAFLRRTGATLGGVALGAVALEAQGLSRAAPAAAQEAAPLPPARQEDGITVPPDAPGLRTQAVQFPGLESFPGLLSGYLAAPARAGVFPGVVVIHENQGTGEHFRDVARRLAREGFVALVPDLLSREGGTEHLNPDQIPGILSGADPERHAADAIAAGAFLRQQPGVHRASYGLIGFCFGGAVVWRAATQDSQIGAAVPYYGSNPPLEAVPNIQAAVLAIYAELDRRVNAGIPALLPALWEGNVRHELAIYHDAQHAFFNDTRERYDPRAAADAWAHTIGWFHLHLPAATTGK